MHLRFVLAASLTLTACGSADVEPLTGDGGVDAGIQTDSGVGPDSGVRVPEKHRAVAETCDNERNNTEPMIPDPNPGPPEVNCTSHADCTDGANGRCIASWRGGVNCTYDACFTDADCNFVCDCGGGFGSDHNVCLSSGGCQVDADCGPGGFCSPTFGSCGDYSGTVAYYCHTPQDECIDDADCGGYPFYCGYDTVAGKWSCKDEHCAG